MLILVVSFESESVMSGMSCSAFEGIVEANNRGYSMCAMA